MRTFGENLAVTSHSFRPPGIGRILIAAGAVALAPGLVLAHGGYDEDGERGVCSKTAKLALKACRAEARDDLLVASAICLNQSDRDDRRDCEQTAREENSEFLELCKEQFEARLEVCDLVGEGPYDPEFDPDKFYKPDELGGNNGGNNWFPLAVGNEWKYKSVFENEEGEEITETVTVRVLDNEDDPGNFVTKQIGITEDSENGEGVTCLVVNDRVEEEYLDEDGEVQKAVIEDTDDWYARNKDTDDVWYCGELARDYETFGGDSPAIPELVSIDGSFKPYRDGDQPGLLVPAYLTDSDVGWGYRQEFSLGNAEDVVEVLSVDYDFGQCDNTDPECLDYLVPVPEDGFDLGAFCNGSVRCRVTRDFSPLEPGVEERKYYAPGIGVVLEVNLADGTTTELVECEVDGRSCSSL